MIVLIHKYLDWRRVILAVAAFVFVWNLSLNHNALASTDKFLSNEPQDAAYVLKRTVQVTPRRYLRWWQNPAAAEPVYNTWSWAPEIKVGIHGPLAPGSQISVEFDTADGKPWFTQRMRTPELEAGRWDIVYEREDLSLDQLEKKAIIVQAGLFPLRVRLKNALSGTNNVIFSGKYQIATYAPDQKIPEYRGKNSTLPKTGDCQWPGYGSTRTTAMKRFRR